MRDELAGETMAVYLPVSEKDFSDVTIGEANSALKLQRFMRIDRY